MTFRNSNAARALVALPILVAALAVPATAHAVEVFFNGVRITGLANRSFENCSVRFDAKGNVYVTAKGYTVKQKPGSSTPPTNTKPTALSQRYFLVSTGKQRAKAQYKVNVYINGAYVKTIKAAGEQLVMPVNRFLRPGKNQVHFAATKDLAGGTRRSHSSAHYLRVLIGVGKTNGGTIRITDTLADFRAPASRSDNFARADVITVR
ncbi:MAG: hypothetical protein KC503_12945 [Myxococcales bacterium]|nr:hypothetical protein [Myxococcales bacterium]